MSEHYYDKLRLLIALKYAVTIKQAYFRPIFGYNKGTYG